MNRAAIALLVAILFPVSTIAFDSTGAFSLSIPNNMGSCGTYVAARDEGRRGKYVNQNDHANWLAGYITAYNVLTPDTNDIKGGRDLNALMLWLENYCKKYPLDDFSLAVQKLTYDLYPKRTKQAPK